MMPRGCSGRALVGAVFVWLGMFSLPAADAWCSRVNVAAWCCGGCRCNADLAARLCRGLCGVPVPDGVGAPVVLEASLVCCGWGEWAVPWGVEVDGLEDVEVVGLRGAPVPDGAGARTLVALVATVVRGRGWVVFVAFLRVEVEDLWCRAPPAVIRGTAALPYVSGCGLLRSGVWARGATATTLRGVGIPLHVS